MKHDLRPYQVEGVETIAKHIAKRKGTLLADDMGLGKTVQSLLGAYAGGCNRLLVICPKSVIYNWEREVEKWLGWPCHHFDKNQPIPDKPRVFIVPWSQVTAAKKKLLKARFRASVVIIDEAHFMKEPGSQRTRAVIGNIINRNWRGIIQCGSVPPIMLTGTPILNRPIEMQTLLATLGAEFAKNREAYGLKYCKRPQQFDPKGYDFKGARKIPELSQRIKEAGVIRRLFEDVGEQLPPVTFTPVVIDPDTNQRKLITQENKLRSSPEFGEADPVVFEEISEVRAELAETKIPATKDHVTEILDQLPEDKGVVVFAHHRDLIVGIAEALGGIAIHGGHNSEQRQALLDSFMCHSRVIVLSIAAMGTGVDGLQHKSYTCVFAEFNWTPAELTQPIGRLKRIGQTHPIIVYFMIIKDSHDVHVFNTVVNKHRLQKRILNED